MHVLSVQMDSAPSSMNPLHQRFCEPYECKLRELMCHTKSSMHWCTTNSAIFDGGKEAADHFQSDPDAILKMSPYKLCGFPMQHDCEEVDREE